MTRALMIAVAACAFFSIVDGKDGAGVTIAFLIVIVGCLFYLLTRRPSNHKIHQLGDEISWALLRFVDGVADMELRQDGGMGVNQKIIEARELITAVRIAASEEDYNETGKEAL